MTLSVLITITPHWEIWEYKSTERLQCLAPAEVGSYMAQNYKYLWFVALKLTSYILPLCYRTKVSPVRLFV